jgi:hypothetical protein
MKSIFFSFVLLVSSLCGATSFVNDDLLALLKVMDVPHDGTLASIVEATQKRWTRPAGKQRWEVKDTLTEVQKKAVMDYCIKMDFFKEIKPSHKNYDYAILLGATVNPMKRQMAHLAKLADLGIVFKQVVLLSGPRPLDPKVEPIPEGCKTEGDAMEAVWKEQPLSRQIPWKHFQCPMMTTPEGEPRTPNRADTLQAWLGSSPTPGLCFMISTQPYCIYQQLVAEHALPQGVKCETIGPAGDPSVQNPAVMLDNIARCLYMMHQSKLKF